LDFGFWDFGQWVWTWLRLVEIQFVKAMPPRLLLAFSFWILDFGILGKGLGFGIDWRNPIREG
jgi:hypothetical protein